MKIIGYTVTTIAIVVWSSILGGWALSKLWAWFIVATFGAPSLSIPAAIGLALIMNYLTDHTKPSEDNRKYWEVLTYGAVVGTLKPLFALLVGAIVRHWL